MPLDRHCTGPQLLLLTATARKEKRRGTVENAHAKKLDKSMRLCERKGGQTSPGLQEKNLVETSAAVHWRAWKKESQQSIRQGSKQGQSRGERSRRLRRASRIDQVFMLSLFYQSKDSNGICISVRCRLACASSHTQTHLTSKARDGHLAGVLETDTPTWTRA